MNDNIHKANELLDQASALAKEAKILYLESLPDKFKKVLTDGVMRPQFYVDWDLLRQLEAEFYDSEEWEETSGEAIDPYTQLNKLIDGRWISSQDNC